MRETPQSAIADIITSFLPFRNNNDSSRPGAAAKWCTLHLRSVLKEATLDHLILSSWKHILVNRRAYRGGTPRRVSVGSSREIVRGARALTHVSSSTLTAPGWADSSWHSAFRTDSSLTRGWKHTAANTSHFCPWHPCTTIKESQRVFHHFRGSLAYTQRRQKPNSKAQFSFGVERDKQGLQRNRKCWWFNICSVRW